MASRIQDLLAQCLGDWYGFKGFNCSPAQHRSQNVVHGALHVAITT
jgi:hypothetical protein